MWLYVGDAEAVAEVALVDVCNHSDVGSVVRKLDLYTSIMEYLLSNKIKFITEDYFEIYKNITAIYKQFTKGTNANYLQKSLKC